MNQTRVLWLTKGLGRGGAEMLLLGLARAMNRDGLTIEIGYRLPHKTALLDSLNDVGIPAHSLGGGAHTWPVELARLLRSGHYDVVHTHAPLVGAVARVVAPEDTVLLHTEHNTWTRYHPATRLVNAVTLGRNERVWAVSEQVAASVRPRWPLRRPPVEVMLHGIDPATLQRGPQARQLARSRLGIDETTFVFGTVGNLAAKKDQASMIRAFALVKQRRPHTQLVIVGTGPKLGELRGLAGNLGVARAVHFLGMRDDVPALLPGFDTFVLSSLHEGLSIALVEALGAGLPVVATNVGGIPQLIQDGTHGLLVPPRDVRALAAAMSQLAGDHVRRRQLAEAGPPRAAKFGIQPAADRLREHYLRVTRPQPAEVAP